MRNKKWLKNITALAMSIVLLVTTVPLALAVDATPQKYNPAPIFSDAAREQGAAAWLEEDGDIMVEFPSAEGGLTYQGYKQKEAERQTLGDAEVETRTYETKEIAAYVLELYDLGSKLSVHDTPQNPVTVSVDAAGAAVGYSANGTISAKIPKAKIDEKFPGGIDLTGRRYNVTISAVDKDGWISRQMYTYVSDVPIFSLTDEEMAPMTSNAHAMREMVRFEGKPNGASSNVYSDSGDGSKVLDRVESGGTIETKGKVDQTGTRDPNGTTDTGSYRILIKGTPNAGGQSFDTAWSRETWSYKGAEEVWFWLDLSQVDIKGISFRLRSNEKQWTDRGGESWSGNALEQVYEADNYADKYGTVYSTVGAVIGGKTPYVYVQQEDGSWEKVDMTNGTIDLAHFKGYVRVPMEFFCSETDTAVQLSNQNMALKQNTANSSSDQGAKDFMNAQYLKDSGGNLTEVQIDPAGTNIEDALLIQRRGIYSQKYKQGWFGTKTWNMTYMKNGIISSDSGDGATFISDGNMLAIRNNSDFNSVDYANTATVNTSTLQVENRDKGLKAIDDVMSAGFAYTGISLGSVDKSVYMDNVLFYRTTGKYDSNSIDGTVKEGFPVETYYNQKYFVREAIFDAIDKYIGSTPNLSDYRAVKYIANMISNYKRVYQDAGQYDNFLNYDKDINSASYGQGEMMNAANALGRGAAWQKYINARKACLTEGTIKLDESGNVKNINNSDVNDLIPDMIKAMEKLPDPESVHQVSATLRAEIIKLYRIYTRLNLGQLNLLGQEEEERLIKYFNLVINAIGGGFVTGKRLANMPYILFNDFEGATVTENGRAYQIENDPTYSSDTDYAHTKGLGTFSTNTGSYATDKDSGLMKSGISFLPNGSWANITDNGFKDSKGVTVTIDNANSGDIGGETSGSTGTWHSVSFSKNSADAATYSDMTNNNMSAEKLGMFAGKNTQNLENSQTEMPLSLIFYADFTELSNFKFNVTIYTKDDQGNLVRARSDMGSFAASASNKRAWRKFFVLDSETGLWKVATHNYEYAYNFSGATCDIDLSSYKGYIMMPLYTFKVRSALDSPDIMDNADSLNSIYKIEFMLASPDGLNNKTYTIDNVGFSYDPAVTQYADVHAQRQAEGLDKTYAEMFGAKSDAAEKFEQAVADIDPYADEATLQAAIADADAKYNDLGSYQYTLQSVIQAKAELERYRDGSFLTNNPKSTMTVDSITAAINALPESAKNSKTVDECELPYPGFNADGTVNYAAYGFADKTAAEEAVRLYEKEYKCMSDTDVASIAEGTRAALINAYGAARRCLSLEDMKTAVSGAGGFLPGLTGIYTQSTKDGVYTQYNSIATRDTADTKWDEIYNRNMPYFAKSILASGGMGTPLQVAQYANLGIPRFLRNTRSEALNVGVTLNDGTTSTQGGIVKLKEKYTAVYNMAKDKIASQTAFTPEELQQISDAVGEYDSLMQAYHDVTEVYNVIEDIKHLFPVHNISLDKENVAYTADNWNTPQTVTYSVAYTESFPVPADSELNKIRIKFKNGQLTNVLNETSEYYVKFKFGDGTESTFSSDYIRNDLNNVLEISRSVLNNQENQQIQIQLLLGDKPTAANEISETLTIELVDKDGNAVQSRSGAPDAIGWNTLEPVAAKTVTFSYTQEDSYIIKIPAEISIPWNSTEAYEAGYKVETSLAEGSKVTVSVSNDGTNTLTESSNTYTLDYTPTNFGTAKEFTGITTEDLAGKADCPTITVSGWDQAAIGEYRTILTYTAEYTSGS